MKDPFLTFSAMKGSFLMFSATKDPFITPRPSSAGESAQSQSCSRA
jgi:hypothetical protein